jgi:hypothetical protein
MPTTSISKLDGMDELDTPESTATTIYNSLKVNGGTQILLAIGFCTDKQRALLAKFGESATSDVIFKTNNEKCPSLHICSKTSSNETFSGLNAYLPNQATWAFDFVWNMMVPALVDPRWLTRNRLMVTDNDDKLYGPFDRSSHFILSNHCLCAFHGMTQVYPKNNITVNCVKNNSKIGLAVLEAMKRSILHWTDDVQRDAEIKTSYNILARYAK